MKEINLLKKTTKRILIIKQNKIIKYSKFWDVNDS